MTADDFVFRFEDIYEDEDIVPTPIPAPRPQGEPGADRRGRRCHGRFRVRRALCLFEDPMAGDTPVGGGRAVRQSNERRHGACAPTHDLEHLLPR
ncbi:MAG: hypothetical protein NZ555_07560 [Geminicoccaceae bacterium]|nr:hypothetical protein [Geminicoccaceae bacterium]MCX8100014.1 hypothetical protein [Geminicoccaceae bacterium]MDW8370032.1 hypothetical protein [Geminicoccaceae bacterium]